MFITWDDDKTKTTKSGTTTRHGTVQTRGTSDDVFDVTMTAKPGNTHGVVGIKHGSETVVSRLLVPLKAPNGDILASIRRHTDPQEDTAPESDDAVDADIDVEAEADAAPADDD